MNDYKSVQDLIIKAAMYDRVSTIISPDEALGRGDVLKVTFSKEGLHFTTYIDMYSRISDNEEAALYACKSALHKLLWSPYEEITCVKGNNNEDM